MGQQVGNARNTATAIPGSALARPLRAEAGSIEDVAAFYQNQPTGRLVVLGAPGTGKTVLLSRLVLDLLDQIDALPASDLPAQVRIPVLLSLPACDLGELEGASSDQLAHRLQTWITARLADQVQALRIPFISSPRFRPGVAPRGIGGESAKRGAVVDAEDASAIGARARMIRRRRGLSLDVVAGLAGISKPYLSALERGQRGFNRRGLIEDLAEALGCSVTDLTGQPYLLVDRQSAAAAATIPGVSGVLHDTTLDDVPDVPARPLPELVRAAAQANAYADDARYAMAGQGLDAVLTELHVHAATGDSNERQAALVALAEACMVAYCLAYRIGHADLAVAAARRGFDAASRAERPDLVGMLAMSRTVALMRVGARRRAASVCVDVLGEISSLPGPTPNDTTVAEACGTLHLTSALVAARDGRAGDVDTHLAEARSLAAHTGERNHLRYHFGPTNVAGWELSIAAENGGGPDAAERFTAAATDLSVLGSKCREGYVRFALARCWAQAEGSRDGEALRALDVADRLAPVVVRNDPLARDLVLTLDRRAPRRVWELDSLRNRFGIGKG